MHNILRLLPTPGYTAVSTKRLNFLVRQLLSIGLDSALGYTCRAVTNPERYLSFFITQRSNFCDFFTILFKSEYSIFSVYCAKYTE